MEILISEMKKLGFERNEIQTINFNVYEDYVWAEQKEMQMDILQVTQ
jgi:uncharacterized protein YggE